MKRWIALAACVLTVAACQDQTGPVGAAPEAQPANLLGLGTGVKIDPVLTTLLNLSAPTDQLQVLVAYDETVTNSTSVASVLTGLGAPIMKFKNLPVVFSLATPAQIAAVTT